MVSGVLLKLQNMSKHRKPSETFDCVQRKGFAAEIGRIELLCSSSLAQLASSLTATLNVLPVSASLLSGTDASSSSEPAALEGPALPNPTSRLPLLELSEMEFSTTVQLVG